MYPPLPPGGLADLCDDPALFVDVDGTLIDIADTPGEAVVDHRTRLALTNAAEACGGALALISGRSLETLDHLFAPLHLPAAGQHGLERRLADGRIEREPAKTRELAEMEDALRVFVQDHPGTILEHKGLTLALHHRSAPQAEGAARKLVSALAVRFAEGFVMQEGRAALELQPRGRDKGTALTAFMDEPPFAGRCPIFLGDDASDEDGFRAAQALGGYGIVVGDRPASRADYSLAGVAEVLRLLDRLSGAILP
jgi:trehalose 6-phosphate phosphatase